jgi:hypothetical protein
LLLRGWIDIKDRSQLIPTRRFIHYRCGFPTPVLARRLLVRARHLLVHAFGVGWPGSGRQKNRLWPLMPRCLPYSRAMYGCFQNAYTKIEKGLRLHVTPCIFWLPDLDSNEGPAD